MRFRPLALILAAATMLTLLPRTAPADVDLAARRAERIERMKTLQHQVITQTAKRREAKRKKRFLAWVEHQRKMRGEHLRPATPRPGQPGSELSRVGLALRNPAGAAPSNLAAIATNRAVSSPAGDVETGSGQSEVMIVANGNNLMAAWNDGEGFGAAPSYQGVAWSTNAGDTWTDAGSPPVTGGIGKWSSDPTLAVNPTTQKFYFCALVDPSFTQNGIAVVEGTIGAGGITWGTPKLVRSSSNSSILYDKQWIVADPVSGNLYLTYVKFTVTGGFITSNNIEITRSTDANVTWSAAVGLSSTNDAGYVQGPRVAVGPAGDVYTIWYAIGKTNNSPYGRDYYRFKRSTNLGVTYGAEVTVDSVFANWGMGAPGFNRGNGITFPGLAVDRSASGPNAGRIYVTWNEAFNFYFDDLGATTGPVETEANNTSGTADPFTIGQELRGQVTSGDTDWWSFTGTAGQSVVVFVDSIAATLDAAVDLMCVGGSSTLGYSALGLGSGALVVATLPVTGTYYLRVAANDLFSTGRYNLATGSHTPQAPPLADRSRDVRDIFVKWSDGFGAAGSWSAPVRANNTPANFDDWLPEVVVAGASGKPYIGWYAFHDYPAGMCAGAGGNYYLGRSEDGGATWLPGSPVSNVTVDWTQVQSNIAPNQGDYVALWGDAAAVHAAWADGRTGDPDIYHARVDLLYTAIEVALASASATPDGVSLTWHSAVGSLAATLEKRDAAGDWRAIGTLIADGTGRIEALDVEVTPGARYGYRLRIVDGGAERTVGETWVDVPNRFELALAGARPNPAQGEVWIAFTLPNREPATLELLDVTGRRVAERRLDGFGPGNHTVNLAEGRRLSAGVYVARLLQGGRALTTRVSVIR